MAPTCVRRGGVGARASEDWRCERCQEIDGSDAPSFVHDPTFAEIPHPGDSLFPAARVPGFVDVGCVRLRTAGSWTSLEDR